MPGGHLVPSTCGMTCARRAMSAEAHSVGDPESPVPPLLPRELLAAG